jgi:hypothetical protein
MDAYIEIMTAALPAKRTIQNPDGSVEVREVFDDHLLGRHELTNGELREIGEFTRGNVLRWMESHKGVDWIDILTWGPIDDFHAVCGDKEIPWAKKTARKAYEKFGPKQGEGLEHRSVGGQEHRSIQVQPKHRPRPLKGG